MVIRRKSKQKRNRSSKRRTSRSKRVSKRTSRRKKTSRRKSKKKTSRKRKSLRKRKTSRKKKSINRRGGTLGFLNSLASTQASIGNVTKERPTPASTMYPRDLRNLDGNKTFNEEVSRNFKPYSNDDDIVQTPEAASRTRNIVFDNSIPAQTEEQQANDKNWWAKGLAAASLIVAPAVLRAQERNKRKEIADPSSYNTYYHYDDDYNDT